MGEWSLINALSLLRRSLKWTSLLVVAGTLRLEIGSKIGGQFHFCLIHIWLVFWISGSLHPGGYVAEVCPSDSMFTLVVPGAFSLAYVSGAVDPDPDIRLRSKAVRRMRKRICPHRVCSEHMFSGVRGVTMCWSHRLRTFLT